MLWNTIRQISFEKVIVLKNEIVLLFGYETCQICLSSLIISSKRLLFLPSGDLLMLLNVSSDEKVLPTTYGELRPPLGKHRLKVSYYVYIMNLICTAIPIRTRLQFDQLRLNSCSNDHLQCYFKVQTF